MLNYSTLKDFIFSLAHEELTHYLDYGSHVTAWESIIEATNQTFKDYDKAVIDNKDKKDKKPLCLRPNYKFGEIVKENILLIRDELANQQGIFVFMCDYETEVIKEEITKKTKESQEISLEKLEDQGKPENKEGKHRLKPS